MSSELTSLRVQWVVDGVQGSAGVGYTSSLASNRYRAILPGQALEDLGHKVAFLPLSTWDSNRQTRDQADVVVVGKVAPGGDQHRVTQLCEQVLMGIQAARQAGVPVVADVNDDHFDHPVVGGYWRELIKSCSLVVVGSESMRRRVVALTSRPVAVIGDPVASPPGMVRVWQNRPQTWWRRVVGQRSHPLQLVWYGNLVNWKPMQQWLDRLRELAPQQPWRLSVVTTPDLALAAVIEQFNRRSVPNAEVELVAWSEEVQWARVSQADVVLLPSDVAQGRMVVKTANRLTDALHAGRFVVASPLPSYQQYCDHVALTDDPVAALRDYLTAPSSWCERIEQGRSQVAAALSPLAIAELWQQTLGRATFNEAHSRVEANQASAAVTTGSASPPPVRLNLGCGDKILPGFVNVDLAENWSGKQPDVVADVTQKLPFPDNYAHEVHAYHVLEHLYRWKAPDCLSEWVRVLKPGGTLILEMPCLDKILNLFHHFQRTGQPLNARLTMWALYGDPNYRNEPMTHRWCYSVDELRQLMSSVGLEHVRAETPQTHIEVRDMRVVGLKPLLQ